MKSSQLAGILFVASCIVRPASAQTNYEPYAFTTLAGSAGVAGNVNGTGSVARFNWPMGMAVDGAGNLYVADYNNHTIRKVTAGVVTTLAGSAGNAGNTDGTGSAARFWRPAGVAVDGAGNVYVADSWNYTIRKVTPGGVVTTLAGSPGVAGSTDGPSGAARFRELTGVAVDAAGNVYAADYGNHTIRKVTPSGVVSTPAGSAGLAGTADGTGSAARFYYPYHVAADGAGTVYVGEYQNYTIRKMTPAGEVSTLAGKAQAAGAIDGTGAAARFYRPFGVAVSGGGDVFVADTYNHTIRKVTPAGVVTTLAGVPGSSGAADGTGSVARFQHPAGVAVDGAGNVYVADQYNNTIRKGVPTAVLSTRIIGLSGNLAFGNVTTGSTATATLTIANSGNAALTVGGIAYPGGFSGAWSGTIAAGGAQNVTVTFAPAAVAAHSGTVTVSSDATAGTGTIGVSGTGVAAAPPPTRIIGLSGNLAFGNVTTGSTATATLTIANSGNAALTVSGIAYPGGFSGAWSGTIAAGGAQNVTVTFAPAAVAAHSGTVTVSSDATAGTGTIGVSGTGVAAAPPTRIIGLSGNLAFGNVATGTTATALLTITNSGTAEMTVDGINYPAGFNGAWSGLIAAGGARNVTVAFTPTAVAAYAGDVTVVSDATGGIGTLAASGTGMAGAAIAGTTNLLINPGAETGDLTGWTAGGDSAPGISDGLGIWKVFPHSGVYNFVGNFGAIGLLSQTVSLIGNQGLTASLLDSGVCFAAIAFWEQGFDQSNPVCDYGSVTLEFLGVTSNVLGTTTTPVIDSHSGSWSNYVNEYSLPVGTRFIRYTMNFFRNVGDNLDAYIDDNSLRVVWADSSSPAIGLSGNLAFGNVTTGATATATLTITNSGTAALTVGGIVYPGGFGGAWSGTIPAGGSQNVTVTFAPTAVAGYSGTVTVNSDATAGTGTIGVSGAGVAVVPATGYTFTTVAGLAGSSGSADGTGSAARFLLPIGVAVAGAGFAYVADYQNSTIRRIAAAGAVTTLAGSAGNHGGADGTGGAARFNFPRGMAADGAGNLFVADYQNSTIRKVTAAGAVTTLAGSAGIDGNADGTGSVARFRAPGGVTADGAGNLYVADTGNNTIRMITPEGVVTTLAGNAGLSGSADGARGAARFSAPLGVVADGTGNLYVADTANHTIRKVTALGVVTTLAGSAGNPGAADGVGAAARFSQPAGLSIDGAGQLFVADADNHTVRKVGVDGTVSTIGGSAGNSGTADGDGSVARFYSPCGVAVDDAGNVYVADTGNNTVRKGVPAGSPTGPIVTTASPLPDGTVGVGYGTALSATGGLTPYAWTVSAGALPAGLSLSTNNGVVGGTPAAAGTAVFTIRCTAADSQFAEKAFSLTIGGGGGGGGGLIAPAVAAGRQHSIALSSTGTVWGWGRGDYAQVGDGGYVTRKTPTPVTNLAGVARIRAGYMHNLAVLTNGTVRAWGANGQGQLGTNVTIGTSPVPVVVPGLPGIRSVDLGDQHSLAVAVDGALWAWGGNGSGQLGDGTKVTRATVAAVPGLTGVSGAAGGSGHTLAVRSNGTAWAWGNNGNGELGDGTTTERLSPAAVVDLAGAIAVAAGLNHSLALKGDGTVWAWGANNSGQLGDGTTTARNRPVAVTSMNGVIAIAGAANGSFSLALKSDGTVWAWGANGWGQLGDGTYTGRNRPVQVTNLTGVVGIAAGMQHGLAVKADGTVWAWGDNRTYGALGNDLTDYTNMPIRVGTLNLGSGGPVPPATGSLTVNLAPAAAVTAGALWNVDGGAWAGSGATVGGLVPGAHTVNFGAAAGWTAPAALAVTVTADATTVTSATYTAVAVTTRVVGVSGNLAFGDVTTGTTATATLTITNSGNAALTVSGIAYPAGFSGAWSGTIPAGGAQNVTVTFAPVAVAGYAGAVTVNSDATGGANTIAASGTGVAAGSAGGAYTFTTLAGLATVSGTGNGTGNAARFNLPYSVAVDGAGNVFVADAGNHTVRKVTAAGVVTTLAGSAGQMGSANGTGSVARFNGPAGVAVDGVGNVFVADSNNDTIRKMTPAGTNWVVTTLAGSALASGAADGTGSVARFYMPWGVAVDRTGSVLVADSGNHTIRKVTPAGTNWVVTTLVGSAGILGGADGTNSAARFFVPSGVAVDGAGNVLVADSNNHTIRKLTPAGTNWAVTTLAGSAGLMGSADGPGSVARFHCPYGIASDGAGGAFVVDSRNHTIRKVSAAGAVTTIGGSASVPGIADGTGSVARFNLPFGVAADGAGNVFLADNANHTIRKGTPGAVSYLIRTMPGPGGTISPANPSVLHGADQIFTVIPDAWFDLTMVTVDGVEIGPITNYLWHRTTGPGVLAATFTAQTVRNAPAPVPRWWLARYGLNATAETAVLDDGDHDGTPTWQEHYADTDPTRSESVLKFRGITGDGLSWAGGTGVVQYLERSTNLPSGRWDVIATNRPPTAVTNTVPLPAGERGGYYRIRVER